VVSRQATNIRQQDIGLSVKKRNPR
jgi:hypothetical protein